MRRIWLKRDAPEPEINSVFGRLWTNSFECYTVENLELLLKPPMRVTFHWRTDSPAHGAVYEADPKTTPGRTNIQIHSANWAFQLLGCIALGRSIQEIELAVGGKQKGVTSSRDAIAGFVADMGKLPFELEVM